MWRFNEYLQEVLALAAAVYESPSFSYTDTLASSVFNSVSTKSAKNRYFSLFRFLEC